jgi:cell division protein FtsB
MVRPKRKRSHGKEIYYILCILSIVGGALLTIFGPGGYLELRKARAELESHRNRVESLRQENRERRETIEQLRSDKEAIEKYAREKGYGKKGEIIQQVPEEGPSGSTSPKNNK